MAEKIFTRKMEKKINKESLVKKDPDFISSELYKQEYNRHVELYKAKDKEGTIPSNKEVRASIALRMNE